jgi:hypothetical protein
MCCEISLCDDFFAVCNIRLVFEKKNTNFGNKCRSYQLSNVSIFKMRLLTVIMLKKVYKNENCFSGNGELNIRNMAVKKLFGLNGA